MAKNKIRIDQYLVELGLADSRTRAQSLIMAGKVMVGEQKITKAGQQIADDADVRLLGQDHPWVSRGGLKLDHAMRHFDLSAQDKVAIDVGSSTGGFTDVLLHYGARKIFAVDSGTNQLAWKIREDPRVMVHEQTSARILTTAHIDEPVDMIVCDASFISLSKVLERPISFAKNDAQLIALIKPQFEAQRHEIGKGGVVRDAAIHQRVCGEVANWLTASNWHIMGIVESPITGPKGNIEFLIYAVKRS
ncbi:TlyA family rRNA (cytidine-2'-O)-methyltransferase [Sphingorhabdus lutea]|uniref:TlyA family rRNA (Cytidine-2'-O)-methyltransferase n=1 Tax=Sphingorhabdus lutea TaxID=1913578 RepID=A0A1L3JFG8_9SPHN|nr:TlyA family RNA methyltransferase [Sphingorhabdus lutea]APG63803.1 TlyA family rRNA (cytidine-2'-O)-methyltransferase [Sphingorhabdus lutea]